MRKVDGKFSTDGSKIFNTVSGEEIPENEPCFLLRARDTRSLAVLLAYRRECISEGCNKLHIAGIDQVIGKFEAFALSHPERMKQPGITRHLKLDATHD